MTITEFEKWYEANEQRLFRRARRRVRRVPDLDPRDVLQRAAETMFTSKHLKDLIADDIWLWALNIVRRAAYHARRSWQRQRALMAEAENFERAGVNPGWTADDAEGDFDQHHVDVVLPGDNEDEDHRVSRDLENPLTDERAKFLKSWLHDSREAFVLAARRRHHFGEPGVPYSRDGWEDQWMEVTYAPVAEEVR